MFCYVLFAFYLNVILLLYCCYRERRKIRVNKKFRRKKKLKRGETGFKEIRLFIFSFMDFFLYISHENIIWFNSISTQLFSCFPDLKYNGGFAHTRCYTKIRSMFTKRWQALQLCFVEICCARTLLLAFFYLFLSTTKIKTIFYLSSWTRRSTYFFSLLHA